MSFPRQLGGGGVLDDDLRALAERQHSVIGRHQARELGATRGELDHRAYGIDWELPTANVMRLRGSAATDLQRAMTAVLDAGPGTVLSHQSAAALWDLPGFRLRDLHVTRRRGGPRREARLATLHLTRVLPPHHVTTHDGIPVTTPARAIFDLAALVHPYRVKRALETSWSKHLLDGLRMAAILDDLGKRGRTGTTMMRELLAERGPDYIPPDSGLESRFHDILVRDGQRPMDRQVHVGGDRWLGRVDFYDREARLIVQIDSERYHSTLIDKEADDRQTADLEAVGFTVLRFTDFEVWYCADDVAPDVRRARQSGA
jgi:very-short-patch-repair endonuclease